jgi:hypothetical protein
LQSFILAIKAPNTVTNYICSSVAIKYASSMPAKPNETALTALGKLIHQNGLAIPFVIAKSGINRNRLAYLRTNKSAILSIKEAQALAPVFKMTLDQFAAELNRLEQEGEE